MMDSPARRNPLRPPGGVALELRESEASLNSRADSPYTDLESNYGCGDSISNDGWNQPSIERCMSCISKLGKSTYSTTYSLSRKTLDIEDKHEIFRAFTVQKRFR